MRSIIGTVLRERYHIVQELSRGGFTITYLAEDRHLPSRPRCIVKRLQPQISSQLLQDHSPAWQDAQKRFVAEAITLHRLGKHAQIPQLLAYFVENQDFYLVEEHIEGKTLAEIVKEGSLAEDEAIALLEDVLKILDFTQQEGVIHRDIRPNNLIRREKDGKIFLVNFGDFKKITLPIEVAQSEPATRIISHQGFIPPEQQEGNCYATSDLYALGKTIIYALTGQLSNRTNLQTLDLNNSSSVLPETEIASKLTQISPRLSSILNKMVRYDYRERYQSAAEVLTELERGENFVTLPPPFMIPLAQEEFQPVIRPSKPKPKISKIIIWLVLILPFLGALSIIFWGINNNKYTRFSTYINNNYQLQIKYPDNWLVKDVEDPITGEVVVFTSPKENSSDIFQEKVFIIVEDKSSEIKDLDEYTQVIVQGIIYSQAELNKLYEQKKSKLSDKPARTIVYSRKANGLDLRQMEIFAFQNDKVYIITYSAERAKYSKFLKTFNQMIKSFEFQE
jgi:serine/threonine-protein kinase